jgi:hypothetical protein
MYNSFIFSWHIYICAYLLHPWTHPIWFITIIIGIIIRFRSLSFVCLCITILLMYIKLINTIIFYFMIVLSTIIQLMIVNILFVFLILVWYIGFFVISRWYYWCNVCSFLLYWYINLPTFIIISIRIFYTILSIFLSLLIHYIYWILGHFFPILYFIELYYLGLWLFFFMIRIDINVSGCIYLFYWNIR